MKKSMCAVYDNKATTWSDPFFATNKLVAQRIFSDGVKDERSNWNRHPSDYELFEIGEYDDQDGTTKTHENKTPLGLANDYIQTDTDLRAVQ